MKRTVNNINRFENKLKCDGNIIERNDIIDSIRNIQVYSA